MAVSNIMQAAVSLSAFFIPVLLYVYFTRPQQQKSTAGALPPPTEITALFVHPIKSCHGLSVPLAKLLPTGLDLDRQWMWVSYPEYEFLTIRQNARMTLIRPSYNATTDTLTITAPAPDSIDEKLEFSIPAHPSSAWLENNTTTHDVHIWNQTTPACVYSPSLTATFNAFFNRDVRLVYKPPTSSIPRPLQSNGAPELLGRVGAVCFPDMMPVLVGTESSIAELNSRLRGAGETLTIEPRRFRPNILVKGDAAAPWDEDRWKTLAITSTDGKAGGKGGIMLDITQRCARCHVPNVDPETAEEHKRQPWDTLMKYRRVDEGITFKPCYGMLCVPREGGEVRVGMKLHVTEVTDKHRYVLPKMH